MRSRAITSYHSDVPMLARGEGPSPFVAERFQHVISQLFQQVQRGVGGRNELMDSLIVASKTKIIITPQYSRPARGL